MRSVQQFRGATRLQGAALAKLSSHGLTAERIRHLAVSGAGTLLKQLRAEIVAIERTFPELAGPAARRQVTRSVTRSVKTAQRHARTMSAAARKAVSARAKKYLAERRHAKAT